MPAVGLRKIFLVGRVISLTPRGRLVDGKLSKGECKARWTKQVNLLDANPAVGFVGMVLYGWL